MQQGARLFLMSLLLVIVERSVTLVEVHIWFDRSQSTGIPF